jgi:4-hydroxybenzoate polyprenyltransferase
MELAAFRSAIRFIVNGGAMNLPLIRAMWRVLRPMQWTKNLFVFMPLIFSARLLDPVAGRRVLFAALLFCAISSSAYLINDFWDIEKDRLHPQKRRRPLASGELKRPCAFVASFFLYIAACLSSYIWLNGQLTAILAGYWILMLAYSLILKNIFLVDIAVIAAGFILRVKAGSAVIPVAMSSWLISCTLLLALFLVMGKRRQELGEMQLDAFRHRPVLESYNAEYLNYAIVCTGIATAACYTLYTFRQEIHPQRLVWTSPFVWFGIARYGQLLLIKKRGGDPSHVLLTDRPVFINVVLWFGMLVWILYGR